eukprot:Hpha_TRINITY_DN34726_c0_g1::TRINITY_DN34726_c0_g1_i1::g.178093::m.178093
MGKDKRKNSGGVGKDKKDKDDKGAAAKEAKEEVPDVHQCLLCQETATGIPSTTVECNMGCIYTVHDRCDKREMEKLTKSISTRKRRMEIFSAHGRKWCWYCSRGKNPVFADCFTAGCRKEYIQGSAPAAPTTKKKYWQPEPEEEEYEYLEEDNEEDAGGAAAEATPIGGGGAEGWDNSDAASAAATDVSAATSGQVRDQPRPQLAPSTAVGAAAAALALHLYKLHEQGREVEFVTRQAALKMTHLKEVWNDQLSAADCSRVLNRAAVADIRGLLRRLGRPQNTDHPFPGTLFVQADADFLAAAGSKRGTEAVKLTKKGISWMRAITPSTPTTPASGSGSFPPPSTVAAAAASAPHRREETAESTPIHSPATAAPAPLPERQVGPAFGVLQPLRRDEGAFLFKVPKKKDEPRQQQPQPEPVAEEPPPVPSPQGHESVGGR